MENKERLLNLACMLAETLERNDTQVGSNTYYLCFDSLRDCLLATDNLNPPAAPLETYFELPEQEFHAVTKAETATAALLELLTGILEASENRAVTLSISAALTDSVANCTIQIPESILNPAPYDFALHWNLEHVATLREQLSVWRIIQSVDENVTAAQVEATYTGHFDNTPQPMGGAGGNMKFRDEGDAATTQPVTTAGGSGTHRTPPLAWRKDN